MKAFTDAGLGLDYGSLSFARTTEAWLIAGSELRNRVAERLAGIAAGVELIGSSSVLGLLAKPIVDLAAGISEHDQIPDFTIRLEADGWTYRGDAGEHGGHVFVLEARPGYRVAHLHVVEHGGVQWQNYLRFRNLLRTNPAARDRYEAEKLRLADDVGDDRKAYQDGKSAVVSLLLRNVD